MLKDCELEEVQKYFHQLEEYITDELLKGGAKDFTFEDVKAVAFYHVFGEINERLKIIEKILDIKD